MKRQQQTPSVIVVVVVPIPFHCSSGAIKSVNESEAKVVPLLSVLMWTGRNGENDENVIISFSPDLLCTKKKREKSAEKTIG